MMRGYIALGILGAVVACATLQKAGDPCGMGDARCVDDKTAFACRDAKVVGFSCTGPKGCSVDGEKNVFCDQSMGAAPMTACLPRYEGLAQCTGVASSGYLMCEGGAWRPYTCSPGFVCTDSAEGVKCVAAEAG